MIEQITTEDRQLLTPGELALRLKVTRTTITNWRRVGRIPAIKISDTCFRFDLEDVIAKLKGLGRLTEADALLLTSMACFNEITNKPVRGLSNLKIKDTYDMATRIDRYMREKFGKNSHEMAYEAYEFLKGKDGKTS